MVSILLPNLNNRPFLDERLQTIVGQTYSEWELVIVDSYSDDGAWELFQAWARKDNRIRLSQVPRAGIYAGWNSAIRLARGKYVYLATSDDTMRPDCLAKMVEALEEHPECGLCDCCLTIIDERGNEIAGRWDSFVAQRYFGELNRKRHIRKAPHDGIIQFALMSAHVSITQLLIRRTLFDLVGLFDTELGSAGDFEWNMRASFMTDVLHLPEYLATWRVHEKQATPDTSTLSNRVKLLEMCRLAVRSVKQHDPVRHGRLTRDGRALSAVYQRDMIHFGLRDVGMLSPKELLVLFGTMLRNPLTAVEELIRRLTGRGRRFERAQFMRDYLGKAWGEEGLIVVLEAPDAVATGAGGAPHLTSTKPGSAGAKVESATSTRR